MADVFHRKFFLGGASGRLEALLWTTPNAEPASVGLVCHPHPLFGGTMHNKVVFQAAKALQSRGIPILRFNFRGAGLSEGTHDGGRGERDDVGTALEFLGQQFTGVPVILVGFSFGAWVGLQVACESSQVSETIGMGLPVNNLDLSFLRLCQKPKLLIQGGNDQFGSRAKVEALFGTLPDPKRLVIVEGVDHFFTGKLSEVAMAINHWLDERAKPSAPSTASPFRFE